MSDKKNSAILTEIKNIERNNIELKNKQNFKTIDKMVELFESNRQDLSSKTRVQLRLLAEKELDEVTSRANKYNKISIFHRFIAKFYKHWEIFTYDELLHHRRVKYEIEGLPDVEGRTCKDEELNKYDKDEIYYYLPLPRSSRALAWADYIAEYLNDPTIIEPADPVYLGDYIADKDEGEPQSIRKQLNKYGITGDICNNSINWRDVQKKIHGINELANVDDFLVRTCSAHVKYQNNEIEDKIEKYNKNIKTIKSNT